MMDMLDEPEAPARHGYHAISHAPGPRTQLRVSACGPGDILDMRLDDVAWDEGTLRVPARVGVRQFLSGVGVSGKPGRFSFL
jgi:hypothetical protein